MLLPEIMHELIVAEVETQHNTIKETQLDQLEPPLCMHVRVTIQIKGSRSQYMPIVTSIYRRCFF